VGEITGIRRVSKRSSRLAVFVDDRKEITIPAEVALKLGLRAGLPFDEELRCRIADCADRVRAREAALSLLAVRARSVKELLTRLRMKGVERNLAENVVGELRDSGLVDDREFGRLWAAERARFRPVGKRRLIQELLEKGVALPVAEEIAAESFANTPELELARKAIKRRAGRVRGGEWAKERARLYSFLLRRGFSYEVASQVLSELARDVDD
jgi:regulatory protein